METLNVKNHQEIVRKIKAAQQDIRKKTLALKLGQSDVLSNIEDNLKPVIEPLEKLVKLKEERRSKTNGVENNKFYKNTPKKRANTTLLNYSGEIDKPQDSIVVDTPEWDPFQTKYNTPGASQIPTLNSESWNEIFHTTIPEYRESKVIEVKRRESTSNLDYYLNMLHSGDTKIDKTSGVTFNGGNYYLNRNQVKFSTQNKKKIIEVGRMKMNLTPGINELLFMRQPNEDLITSLDVRNYKKIADSCGFIGDKKLKTQKLQTFLLGRGLLIDSNMKKDYVYWNDPNELVTRLELLHASKSAGHTRHNNEIVSIEEELKEGGYIQ